MQEKKYEKNNRAKFNTAGQQADYASINAKYLPTFKTIINPHDRKILEFLRQRKFSYAVRLHCLE